MSAAMIIGYRFISKGRMFQLIAEKPHLGILFSGAGFVSGVLSWLHIITPFIGFFGAAFGMVAGFLSLLIKWREWKKR